jgi:UDP-glucose:(heptosyl)LPS alpha-1,3-glucosyltransferase
MKLLFCLFHYFPYGGLQRDCLRIAQACMVAGHQVDIITQTWEGPRIPGITVHCFPMHALSNHHRCEKFAHQVATFIKTSDYQGVIGFNKMPGLDIYYAADPCYLARNQGWKSCLPRARAYRRLEESVFSPQQKTHIFLINPKQQVIFSHYYGTQAERFHLLPPGIDPSRRVADMAQQQRGALRQTQGIDPNQKILLFLASAFKTKGLDRALTAMASLPETMQKTTQLWIAGHDQLKPYQSMIKQLNLSAQIKYLGPSDNVPELLMIADLLLHPAYTEVAGMVLLEALVAGLPVLTTSVCGYAHYIEESGAGIVIPEPFSQTQLNTALLELLSFEHLAPLREKANQFSQTAQVYNMPKVAIETIEQILS